MAGFPKGRRNGDALRVLHFVDSMSVGGTELNAVRLAERLHRVGYTQWVACFRRDGPLSLRYEAAGIPIVVFPVRRLISLRSAVNGLRFAGLLRRLRIDIVHSHDRYTNLFATPWARLAEVPAIVSKRYWLSTARHAIANRLAYRIANRVLTNSRAIALDLVAKGHVADPKVVVVPNFLDEGAFVAPPQLWQRTVRESLDISTNTVVLGVVANLHSIKGHETLLHAFALLRQRSLRVTLVIVGDGPMRSQLECLAETLQVKDSTRFAGRQEPQPSFHWLFDISVLSSITEGSPNSLLEAMAAGRPVVATEVGGIPDLVRNNGSGLLVPPGNHARLAEALACLVLDDGLRARFGALGKRIAMEQHSAARVVGLLDELYRDLARQTAKQHLSK